MTSRDTHPAGTRYGSYILGERLAAGGMAEVYTAQSLQRCYDTPIVLKRMLPHLASDRSFVSMFIDEARLSTRLDHPNIVKVYDFEATERGLSLVMELIDGPDLLAVLKRCAKRRERMPAEHAVYITCHVLEALDYAHHACHNDRPLNVVHRDVSPSNILLTRRGHVKLADFGIARAAERQQETATGTLKGKYGYMSPEQILGAEIDGRSDLFATGIVLAEMLMGRRLFAAPSDLELLLMVRRADLTRYERYGEHVPEELDAIVRRALARDRDERYQSAGELRDVLASWLSSSETRTGAVALAAYLDQLEGDDGELCAWRRRTGKASSTTTLSGPQTKLARIALKKAAQVGRHVFALGAAPDGEEANVQELVEDFTLEPVEPALEAPERAATSAEWELDAGDLDEVHPIDLLCQIAVEQRTGLLVVRQDELIKELYFVNGHPEFVRSNVHSDRFGQFLVRKEVITEGQLRRVLAALPHFEGRMGQALVSLGLLAPVDAVRLLSEQVSSKILDLCGWRRGRYTFRPGEQNPWPALALQLDTLRIVGGGLATLPAERLEAWVERHHHDAPLIDRTRIAEFGFDARTARLLHVFVGKRSLGQILEALPRSLNRERFLAAAYVAARCKVLEYEPAKDVATLEPIPTKPQAGDAGPRASIDPGRRTKPQAKDAGPRTSIERRRFRRVRMSSPGVLEMPRRTGAEPVEVEVCSVTCEGLGLRFNNDRFYRLRRGEYARLRFHNGIMELSLEARIAWCADKPGNEVDVGLRLELALVPAWVRESFSGWAAAIVHSRANPDESA